MITKSLQSGSCVAAAVKFILGTIYGVKYNNPVASNHGEPLYMRTQYKVGLFGSLLIIAVVACSSATAMTVPSSTVHFFEENVYSLDHATPSDLPIFPNLKTESGEWELRVYSPILWTDQAGNEYQLDSLNNDWKRWLKSFGRQVLKRWCADSTHPNETCSTSITLMGERKPVNGLSFTPEQSAESESFTEMVKAVTGISQGKQLAAILPRGAKSARALYLNLRFVHR
jgi:hypothetical protein